MREQAYQRGMHVGSDHKRRRRRQQRDIVGGNERVELDRALAQHNFGQGRESIVVGFRLRRKIHQPDAWDAHQLLHLVGIGRRDSDGHVCAAVEQWSGIGR